MVSSIRVIVVEEQDTEPWALDEWIVVVVIRSVTCLALSQTYIHQQKLIEKGIK